MHAIHPTQAWPLWHTEASRQIEQAAMQGLPAHTLMQRAGLAVARLALAVAPHARTIWVACGPGNNGGDGLEAALHLHRWGKQVCVTWLGDPQTAPADAQAALARAQQAGVVLSAEPPNTLTTTDLAIDALLGLGSTRAPAGRMAQWIQRLNAGPAPVLAVDLPTGLHADTGALVAGTPDTAVRARHTLCLLALKPGLFTALGRDAAGQVWLDMLGVEPQHAPSAWLAGPPPPDAPRTHASHKGSFGDVVVLGGGSGMVGAALLAGSAALHGGAGRVFVGLLDHTADACALVASQPELMFRAPGTLDLARAAVVCGCGGGEAVQAVLPQVLAQSARLVLDADALNALAATPALQGSLRQRAADQRATVLTPHPLEAARLLGCSTAQVQANRFHAAQALAERFGCTVALKGSGSVIATPGQPPVVNPTGNARLATAGTGDVLAGMLGALLAQGLPVHQAAQQAVWRHGLLADTWPPAQVMTASGLARHGV
jgi:hydroxyethylthiazole kinase-like uncharacterized protein yjeF